MAQVFDRLVGARFDLDLSVSDGESARWFPCVGFNARLALATCRHVNVVGEGD